MLISAGADGLVRTWSLDPATAIQHICAATGETLTPDRWRRYAPGLEYRRLCPAGQGAGP